MRLERYTEARRRALASFRARYVADALRMAGGSVSGAAKLVGMDRGNFRRLLRRVRAEAGE